MPRLLESRRDTWSCVLLVCMAALLAVLNLHTKPDAANISPSQIETKELTERNEQPLLEFHEAIATGPPISRLPPPKICEFVEPDITPIIDSLPPILEEEIADEPLELSISDEALIDEPIDLGPEIVEPPMVTSEAAPSRAFSVEEFDHDAELAASTSFDDVLAYFPAEKELSEQLKPRVQEAFTLARNGALHAARARFEELLHELVQAKDASGMTGRHTRSLAAGLRALDEADDFVAVGSDREVSARSLAAGHQTPMLHETDSKWTLPHEAIAMYHLYAQQKLAAAVEGEQAGSMMLFGLGKIYALLAERDDLPQAIRKSLTMYRGAVAAHPRNHLAANEAGVLLARAGRYTQALPLLGRAAQLGGASTTHRNLAYVHTKLGDIALAEQHRELAERIARSEVARGQLSAERGIAWVPPDEFNRRSRGTSTATVASRPVAAPPQQTLPPPSIPTQRSTTPPAKRDTRPTFWW